MYCFHVAFWIAFFADMKRFWPPNGVLFGVHFRRLADFGVPKQVLKMRPEQLQILSANLGGSAAGAGPV